MINFDPFVYQNALTHVKIKTAHKANAIYSSLSGDRCELGCPLELVPKAGELLHEHTYMTSTVGGGRGVPKRDQVREVA